MADGADLLGHGDADVPPLQLWQKSRHVATDDVRLHLAAFYGDGHQGGDDLK